MPRYFFHLNLQQDYVDDPEGAELPDLQRAVSDAIDAIREIAAFNIKNGEKITIYSIRICDDARNALAEVSASEVLANTSHFAGPSNFCQPRAD